MNKELIATLWTMLWAAERGIPINPVHLKLVKKLIEGLNHAN